MRTITTLFAFAAVTTPLAAQGLPGACSMLPDLTVGHWASYQMNVPEMGGTMQMRLAVVGTDEVDGKTLHWVEMKMTAAMGEMIMQVLVPDYPYDDADVAQMIVKAPGQPAMRMSPEMMAMGGATSPAGDMAKSCQEAEKVGDETVVVGAGSFNTVHYRITTEPADVWISSSVPFGIVKLVSNDVPPMELQDHGTDATSSLTDVP